ncbi:CpXC domain-containing protein [Sorangium sp. So ce381]|uniref:CpXC domain-containing protein n=1 Tax=Sorangium sp. So ce381 TaxID=3133307 RepID=UPI003F5B44B0
MHRYEDPLELSCARCGPVTVPVTAIIDFEHAAHRDELVAAICSGTIHQVACPGCGSALSADAPLLLHVPGEQSMLFFSPAQETNAERDQAVVRALVARWWTQRQPWGSDRPPMLVPVLREHLPGVFAEGALEKLQQLQRDPAAHGNPLLRIAWRFMKALSWEEAYLVVRQHPELLKLAGEEGEGARAAMLGTAQALKSTADTSAIEEGLALLHRCEQVGIEGAFAEKLRCAAEELERLAAGSSEPLPDVLEESESAERRYRETGDLEALDRAAALWEEALFRPASGAQAAGRSERHLRAHLRLAALEGAAGLFLQRHQARGALSDLDRATALWSQALDEAPVNTPERLRCLSNLGTAYRMRFERTARMDHLEQAISLSRQALDAGSSGSPALADVLVGLATCIRKRFERTGQSEDLDESFVLYRRAFEEAPAGSPGRRNATIGLGNALLLRYRRDGRAGRMEDIEEAIVLHRQALDATPAGSSDLPMNLKNLGEALRMRFERTGRMKDLDESIALDRRIVAAIPPDSPSRPRLLSLLGASLSQRHQRMGRLEDLEEAISVFRGAIDAGSPELPNWPLWLNGLGTVLRTRSEHTGRKEDLEEAIATFRRARAAIAPDAPDRRVILNNLGAALRKRYERSTELKDLQEAIALFRYNLDAAAPGSSDLPLILSTLGNALGTRYLEMRQMGDLQEAIAVYRRALDALPASSPDRPIYLKNLALWLERRYESTEQIDDLAEANATHREAARLKRELDAEAGVAQGLMLPIQVACPRCGPVTVKTWVILDLEGIERRPELLGAIRSGTIQQVVCHRCGAELGVADMPLLLVCPGPERTLVFSPAQNTTDEQDQEHAAHLVEEWRKLLGESGDDVSPRAVLIPRELLPAVVDEGVETAQARFAAAMAEPEHPVMTALVQLVSARTVDELYLVLHEHLELIGGRAEPALLGMMQRASAAGDEVTARRYEEHAAFLRRCRELGVQNAYDEFRASFAVVVEAEQFPRSIQAGVREAEYHEERYLRSKQTQALDAAIACRERVLSDPGLDLAASLVKADQSSHAARLLRQRYEARGELSDLERAITLGRQALEMLPSSYQDRPAYLANLGACLQLRYDMTARSEDLEEAIALERQAVDAGYPASPARTALLRAGLGGGLLKRYERTGQMEDLEDAVGICRAALDLDPTSPWVVNALGRALHARYHRMGKPEDLDELIAICRQARDPVAPDRPACLQELGIGLLTRYEKMRNVEDLDEAIAVHQRDLHTIPADSPRSRRIVSLTSMADALRTRYQRTARVDDLQDAIALLRLAVNASPHQHECADHLGLALVDRYRCTGALDDLQEGIALLRRAVDAAAPASPKPQTLNSLSVALVYLYQHTREMGGCRTPSRSCVRPWRPRPRSRRIDGCCSATWEHG